MRAAWRCLALRAAAAPPPPSPPPAGRLRPGCSPPWPRPRLPAPRLFRGAPTGRSTSAAPRAAAAAPAKRARQPHVPAHAPAAFPARLRAAPFAPALTRGRQVRWHLRGLAGAHQKRGKADDRHAGGAKDGRRQRHGHARQRHPEGAHPLPQTGDTRAAPSRGGAPAARAARFRRAAVARQRAACGSRPRARAPAGRSAPAGGSCCAERVLTWCDVAHRAPALGSASAAAPNPLAPRIAPP